MQRLTRSQHDRMLGGVCSGLARAWQLDVTLVRLVFILLALAGGTGILLYLLLLILMPIEGSGAAAWEANPIPASERQRRTTLLVGGGLILMGAWLLLGHIPGLHWITLRNLGPLLLIAVGIWLIVNHARQREG
jgi:phage shock protein PspC (stress-responsive transcriptional regulator)